MVPPGHRHGDQKEAGDDGGRLTDRPLWRWATGRRHEASRNQEQRAGRPAFRDEADEQTGQQRGPGARRAPGNPGHPPQQGSLQEEQDGLHEHERIHVDRHLVEGENEADDNRGRGARDAPRGVGEQDDGQCPEDRLNLEDARDGGSKRAAEEGEQVRVEGAHEEGVPSHGSLAEDELRPVPVDLAVGPQAPAQRRGREPTQVRDAPGPGEQEDDSPRRLHQRLATPRPTIFVSPPEERTKPRLCGRALPKYSVGSCPPLAFLGTFRPIEQALAIVAGSVQIGRARQFRSFLSGGPGNPGRISASLRRR